MVTIQQKSDLICYSDKNANITLAKLQEKEQKALVDFRNALQDIENGEESVDDEYLLRFLRMKHFDIQDSVRLYKKSKKYMNGNFKRDVIDFPFSECIPAFHMNVFTVLKSKQDGSPIGYCRPRFWTPDTAASYAMLKYLYLVMEEIQTNPDHHAPGIIALIDFGGLSMRRSAEIVSQFTLPIIKLLVGFGQGGAPFRLRGIYTVNTPRLVVSSYNALVKYLLQPKMRDRIIPHSGGVHEFQRYIDIDNLPESLGGTIPDDEAEDTELVQRIFAKYQDTNS